MRLDDRQQQEYKEYLKKVIPGFEHLLPEHDMLFTTESFGDRLKELHDNLEQFQESHKEVSSKIEVLYKLQIFTHQIIERYCIDNRSRNKKQETFEFQRNLLDLARLSTDYLFMSLFYLLPASNHWIKYRNIESGFTLIRNSCEVARAISFVDGDPAKYARWVRGKRKGRSAGKFLRKDSDCWEEAGQMIYKAGCSLGTHAFDTGQQLWNFEHKPDYDSLDSMIKQAELQFRELRKMLGIPEDESVKFELEDIDDKEDKFRYYGINNTLKVLVSEELGLDIIGFWFFTYFVIAVLSYRYFVKEYPEDLCFTWEKLDEVVHEFDIRKIMRFDIKEMFHNQYMSIYNE